MSPVGIYASTIEDIAVMVALSKAKRLAYEKVEPQFWRHADNAETAQAAYFKNY